ncbi:hypothetical protein, partial [Pseudomonas viridiflava]|uniref:hypothetical protein n=1 Tax=Pseudomonas viridiflava TaxID=33069 RepID=UPI001BAEB3E1
GLFRPARVAGAGYCFHVNTFNDVSRKCGFAGGWRLRPSKNVVLGNAGQIADQRLSTAKAARATRHQQ